MSDPSSDAFVQYECSDRIATITFNRPEKLNAFNDAMVMRLAAVLHEFDIDESADVAVLRGNGRAFCSGADVHQRQLRSDEDLKKHGGSQGWGAHAADLFTRAINWKPVIAAPHGFAVGLGLGMVLESEMVVAEAGLAAGVIDRVAPAGEHLAEAHALAKQIAANPPLSVRATVRTRRWYMDQAEREAYLQTTPLKLHLTEDFKESARAFAEKRPAGPFKGR